MLTNKKELLRIQENIDAIPTNLSSIKEEFLQHTSKNFQELIAGTQNVLTKIQNIEDNERNLSNNLKDEVSLTSELNIKLKKQIDSFKLLEEQAKKRLLEDTKFEIQKQLSSLFETTRKYKDLEVNLLLINKRVETIEMEIQKFVKIAQGLKSTDFELAKFAKEVTRQDQEKLRLMRENEKLKMLIARHRHRG